MNKSDFGGIRLPADIEAGLCVVREDIRITQQDTRRKRSIERDESMGPCGLRPGEFDRSTVQAYLTLVDEYALRGGDSPEELTRAAFNVYMGLRKEEYFIRNESATDARMRLEETGGRDKPGDNTYAGKRKEFRKELKAKRQ
ncbi:hypothetical protein [Parachryseolinea silvisoli]|uniref:hypothetical protein n=1 Tax=Parachryseolinea silvisoli TaxID=2873601 RepID=UPI002265CC8F|nr:hypothetical protein [Parachryseolinea silvisoli]MCD9015185.1 hypothetical protein [Parachryseolinea silvisoli]